MPRQATASRVPLTLRLPSHIPLSFHLPDEAVEVGILNDREEHPIPRTMIRHDFPAGADSAFSTIASCSLDGCRTQETIRLPLPAAAMADGWELCPHVISLHFI